MVQVQFGFRGFPLGAGGFGAFLPPAEFLLEALIQVPQFTRSHHRRVALGPEGEFNKSTRHLGVSLPLNTRDVPGI